MEAELGWTARMRKPTKDNRHYQIDFGLLVVDTYHNHRPMAATVR